MVLGAVVGHLACPQANKKFKTKACNCCSQKKSERIQDREKLLKKSQGSLFTNALVFLTGVDFFLTIAKPGKSILGGRPSG